MASGEKNLPQIPNVMAEFQDIIEDLNKIAGGYTQTQLMTVSVPREVWDGAAKAAYTRDLEVLKGKMEQMRASVDQCKGCRRDGMRLRTLTMPMWLASRDRGSRSRWT